MIVTITLVVVMLVSAWMYMKCSYSYWSSRGVKGPEPQPIVGHFTKLMSDGFWDVTQQYYEEYKEQGYFGTYEMMKPSVFICEPEHIKNILVKDFDHFVDRRDFHMENCTIGEMLFIIRGSKWKSLRSIMSPTFSSGKIKHMYGIVEKVVDNFLSRCEREKNCFDAKDVFGRYTMSVISTTAFGMETNSLSDNNCPFSNAADSLFGTDTKKMFKNFLAFCLPKVYDILGISFDDESTDFFDKCCREAIRQRRENCVYRGDFLDLLLTEQKKQKDLDGNKITYEITDRSLVAQSIMFLLAGYDTTSSLLTFVSFNLAKYPQHQDTLRKELQSIVDEGDLDYYKLMAAPFLDACCSEALRLNPPLAFLERHCIKDYDLPNTKLRINKSMIVQIPVWGLHRDERYWQNPEMFDPFRFMPENKDNIKPGTYMPFGYGPRNCIAMRFALMEAKLCLTKFLLKYKIENAPGHEQIKLEAGDGIVRPVNGAIKLILSDV